MRSVLDRPNQRVYPHKQPHLCKVVTPLLRPLSTALWPRESARPTCARRGISQQWYTYMSRSKTARGGISQQRYTYMSRANKPRVSTCIRILVAARPSRTMSAFEYMTPWPRRSIRLPGPITGSSNEIIPEFVAQKPRITKTKEHCVGPRCGVQRRAVHQPSQTKAACTVGKGMPGSARRLQSTIPCA